MTKRRPWTEDDLGVLRRWYESRPDVPLELDKLAAELGRSRVAVCIKARRLGLTDLRRKTGAKDRRKFKGDSGALRRATGENMRRYIQENGHPRGMLGKKKSKASVARSVAGYKRWLDETTPEELSENALRAVETRIKVYGTAAPPGFMDGSSNPYSRAKRGRRADLGDIFFRSRWEANYARFLNLLKAQGKIEKWEYEPDTFWFEAIKRGVRSYTPDFKVWDSEGVHYDEVKGWMDAKSKTKLKRMKKYHPDVDLRVFGAKAYRELERKLGRAIPGWED